MSEPATEFLRRSQVLDWLGPEGLGFSRSYVRALLSQGVIRGAPLPERKAIGKKSAKPATAGKLQAKSGKNGTNGIHRGRKEGDLANYYRKSQIKKELGL